jgi:hypothetical protein
MKPLWYLDVDGVINMVRPALPQHRPEDVPEDCWRTRQVNGYPITWDTRVIATINELHRAGRVEICWLTTWESDAARLLAPALEFDDFRTPPMSQRLLPGGRGSWWKWESVKHHAVEDHHDQRAIIWTDDDLGDARVILPGLAEWFRDRASRELETLGISPNPARGLTMAHLADVRSVCSRAC